MDNARQTGEDGLDTWEDLTFLSEKQAARGSKEKSWRKL